ncbi:DUF2867 domain-containing protein [Nocardioides sp.]|uniref:DUF2867 domain-containing protein n=1 Tax=Nocardioides sp. TaxID=35761 RepID=UPI0027365C46|nr:DUF2867 domain-containing protein [Nocardioides sp.]MDP3894762.1 DUF2867 domain-containing protein [Nocardioides sp.]
MDKRPRVVNVHERHIAAAAAEVGALLDTWGSPGDQVWRSGLVEPAAFERGLTIGSRGGHGPIRYHVVEHTPGRSVRVEFEPDVGVHGHHGFEVRPVDGNACLLRHELVGTPYGAVRLAWPLLIRPIHDGAVEDVLDHVERTVTGSAHRPHRTGRLTTFVAQRLLTRWVEACDQPPGPLQAAALDRVDASDCWTTPLLPEDSEDPLDWARALFGGSPGLLIRLRDLLVRPFGLEPAAASRHETGFPQLALAGGELLLGLDDRHLDFRTGLSVRDRTLHVTTTVRINSAFGRAYWGIVRHIHPLLVRRMLRRLPLPEPAGGLPAAETTVGVSRT